MPGVLYVRVLKGSNLVIGDLFVKSSDPYVVITLGEQTARTGVKKETLNPVWDEELKFTDVSTYPGHGLLTVEVLDVDRFPKFKRKNFLGEAKIDLEPLLQESYPMETGKKLVPQRSSSYLVKDSWIVQHNDGRIVQDVVLKLGRVKSGLLEIRLEWEPERQSEWQPEVDQRHREVDLSKFVDQRFRKLDLSKFQVNG